MAISKIGSKSIATGAVSADVIADGSIDSDAIGAGAVGTTKLQDNIDLSAKTVTLPTLNQTVTATAFVGDGSGLTGLPTSLTDLGLDNHNEITVDSSGNLAIGANFFANSSIINSDYTVDSNYNVATIGPITMGTGTVTIPTGSSWTII